MERESWADQTSWCGWNWSKHHIYTCRLSQHRPMHSLPLHTNSSGSPCGAIFVHIIRTTLSNMTMPVSYWNSHNRLSSPKISMEVMPWFDWTCDMRFKDDLIKSNQVRQLQLNLIHPYWSFGLAFPWHLLNHSFMHSCIHSFNIQQMCCWNQLHWRTYTILTFVPHFF